MNDMEWNARARLVISDVDDTIAKVFHPATLAMVAALERLLAHGTLLFLISGQHVDNIVRRVVQQLSPDRRCQILIAHCNGAEVFGFDALGAMRPQPLFSVLHRSDRRIDPLLWRQVIECLIERFELVPFPLMEIETFRKVSRGHPWAVMIDDRRVQISLDFVNWLFEPPPADIRPALIDDANQAFQRWGLDLEAKAGGTIAVDTVVAGVHKGLPLELFIAWGAAFRNELPDRIVVGSWEDLEVWGDQFSVPHHGSDLAMTLALPPQIRSICFRRLSPEELPTLRRIHVWTGQATLHEGLLEYLIGQAQSEHVTALNTANRKFDPSSHSSFSSSSSPVKELKELRELKELESDLW